MPKTQISQGPWTRIRPLQRDEIDPYTEAGMTKGEITWGHFRNNLGKVMAYLPRMVQTEVEYCNTFIFDPPTFRGDVQEAGFNDRLLKELVISRVSLYNRSRYSVTHHAFIGWATWDGAGRAAEAVVQLQHAAAVYPSDLAEYAARIARLAAREPGKYRALAQEAQALFAASRTR